MPQILVDKIVVDKADKAVIGRHAALKEAAMALPQVVAGGVSEEQVDAWLYAAVSVYDERSVRAILMQNAGFRSRDMQALIAYDTRQYFPPLHAKEVWDQKSLRSIPAMRTVAATREALLLQVAKRMLSRKLGANPDAQLEGALYTPRSDSKAPWLICRPGLVTKTPSGTVIYDIRVDGLTPRLGRHSISAHVAQLAATNCGDRQAAVIEVNLSLKDELKSSLEIMGRLTPESRNQVLLIAEEMGAQDLPEARLVSIPLNESAELYTQILHSGESHWQRVLQGMPPEMRVDPVVQMSDADRQDYIAAGQNLLVSHALFKKSEASLADAKRNMQGVVGRYDIHDNFQYPFDGHKPRKKDFLDLDAATEYLEKDAGIPPAFLRDPSVDQEKLLVEFQRLGGDVATVTNHTTANRGKIESVAASLGISLEEFTTRRIDLIPPTTTRGPRHEVIEAIKESAADSLAEMKEELLFHEALQSPLLVKPVDEEESSTARAAPSMGM